MFKFFNSNDLALKKIIIFAFISLNCTMAFGLLFDNNGVRIPLEEESSLYGQKLVESTNLKVSSMSVENPFEWSNVIEFDSPLKTYPCSGGVVALSGYKPTDKVLVLTAGHCVRTLEGDYLKPKMVIVNEVLEQGRAYLKFPRPRTYLSKPQGVAAQDSRFEFTKIIFASFDFVDLALLEMELTYEQLDFRGYGKPPIVSSEKLHLYTKTRAFGIPMSPRLKSTLFHQSECNALEFSSYSSEPINIGQEYKFMIVDSILNNCTLLAGMSGGYVRNPSGEVIGVNGGANIPGKDEKMYSYFNPIYPLSVCSDKNGKLKNECLNEMASLIHNWKIEEFAKRFGSSFENK